MRSVAPIVALILTMIAGGIAPVAQALPCILHQPDAAAPCPHSFHQQVHQQSVADCFTQAVPLPSEMGLPDHTALPALAPLPLAPLRIKLWETPVWITQHPPPTRLFASTQRWRI